MLKRAESAHKRGLQSFYRRLDAVFCKQSVLVGNRADDFARYAAGEYAGRYIPRHDASGGNYRIRSYRHAAADCRGCGYPDIVPYFNRLEYSQSCTPSSYSLMILSSATNGCMGVATVTRGPNITLSPISIGATSSS